MTEILRIYVDCEDITYFDVRRKNGLIIGGKLSYKDDFESTYIDLSKVKVGKPLNLSFNVSQNKKLGLEPVYSEMNFIVTGIKSKIVLCKTHIKNLQEKR